MQLWVTLLSRPALARMHETEGGYRCVRLLRPAAFLLPDPPADGASEPETAAAAWPAEVPLHVYVCRYRLHPRARAASGRRVPKGFAPRRGAGRYGCFSPDGQGPVALAEVRRSSSRHRILAHCLLLCEGLESPIPLLRSISRLPTCCLVSACRTVVVTPSIA